MEHSAKHPSTVFSVATHRHSTEEQAIAQAMEAIYGKVAAHREEAPNTAVVSLSTKTTSSAISGYSARVSVTVMYLI